MSSGYIAIPTILKVGPGTLKRLGDYLAAAGMNNAVIYFGNGLIDMFGYQVMDSLADKGIKVLEYRELDSVKIEDIIELAFNIDSKTQVIVGIGGGKVIDAAKYASYLKKLPFISIPTSSSSDGFSSASASLIVNGRRTSVPAKM
ncbi:MAG: iron-containing alcohol dehydrogenase, partial [Lachnospiraceae bacterium]|nr:iron-containing alcohol dehydrogenase [Lachnospiraceae bacterium]